MSQARAETDFTDVKSARWKIWTLFFLLACLFHSILFLLRLDWTTAPSTPIEVNRMSHRTLEAVKRQWKQQQLLVDKNPALPSEQEASPDARYMSDRNIRVEKEQKARETTLLPQSGTPHTTPPEQKSQPKPLTRSSPPVANLGSLGVPFHLDSAALPHEWNSRRPSSEAQGGDQSFLENNLPEGSENLLNAKESIFYSFYARMRETIAPIWYGLVQDANARAGLTAGDYTTTVDAVLDEGGKLIEVRRLQSSGVAALDEVAEESWKRAQGFPNPPKALLDAEKQVHIVFSFRFSLSSGPQVRYSSPRY